MSKYDDIYNYHKEELPLMADEEVLWSGKPKKAAYLFGQSVQGMAIAIIWLIADLTIILEIAKDIQGGSPALVAIIPFFIFHLIPVWVWVKQIITATRKWRNTFYYVTDKRILISDGFFAENYHTIYYKDIQGVNLHIGILDKLFKTGDVFLELNHSISVGTRVGTTAYDTWNACSVDFYVSEDTAATGTYIGTLNLKSSGLTLNNETTLYETAPLTLVDNGTIAQNGSTTDYLMITMRVYFDGALEKSSGQAYVYSNVVNTDGIAFSAYFTAA